MHKVDMNSQKHREHTNSKLIKAALAFVVFVGAILGTPSQAFALGAGDGGYTNYWGHSYDGPQLVVQTIWQVTGASVRVCAQGTSLGNRIGSRACGAKAFVQWNGNSNWYSEGGIHWGNTDSIHWTT